jgi:hypothetical protein
MEAVLLMIWGTLPTVNQVMLRMLLLALTLQRGHLNAESSGNIF